MRRFVRDACLSIVFWQTLLTPYFFFFLHFGWGQYGRWCLSNMVLSAVIGPLFVRFYSWMTNDSN